MTFSTTAGQLSQSTALTERRGEARTAAHDQRQCRGHRDGRRRHQRRRPRSRSRRATCRPSPSRRQPLGGQHQPRSACRSIFTLDAAGAGSATPSATCASTSATAPATTLGRIAGADHRRSHVYTRAGSVHGDRDGHRRHRTSPAPRSSSSVNDRSTDPGARSRPRAALPAASSTSAPASPAPSARRLDPHLRVGLRRRQVGATTTGPSDDAPLRGRGTYIVQRARGDARPAGRLRPSTTDPVAQAGRVIARVPAPASRGAPAPRSTTPRRACRRARSGRSRSSRRRCRARPPGWSGSGSAGTVCQVSAELVIGSFGTSRM